MIKPKVIIIVSGILVLIGIGITVYESQLTLSNLANQQQNLSSGSTMTVSMSLDPSNSKTGVYSIQITDFKDGDDVKVDVFDPAGTTILAKSISKNSFQENFTISLSGQYKLKIENSGTREIETLGIIGYYPQNTLLWDTVGFVALVTGLSGIAVGILYLLKSRGKTDIS